MLHLALAGNILRALDGTQTLYDKLFLPTYPSQILFEQIDMKLQPANKDNLECFLKVRARQAHTLRHYLRVHIITTHSD